jgi:hypothetical protein
MERVRVFTGSVGHESSDLVKLRRKLFFSYEAISLWFHDFAGAAHEPHSA